MIASYVRTELHSGSWLFGPYREEIKSELQCEDRVTSGALPVASHAHLSIGQFNRYVYKCNISIVVARLLSVRPSVATANEFRSLIASRCVRAYLRGPSSHITY